MRPTKLRFFIFASLIFHLVVLIIFLALFIPKNIIENSSSEPISFGVISKLDGADQNRLSSLISQNNENPKRNIDYKNFEEKRNLIEKSDIKKTENLNTPKQKRTFTTRFRDDSNKKKVENELSRQVESLSKINRPAIDQNTRINTETEGFHKESDFNSSKVASLKSGKKGGTDNDGLEDNMALAYPDYKLIPKPTYPMIARRRGYEGAVFLKVFVLESGSVGDIELERSSGYEILDESALDAVKDWVFIPGKRNGEAISSWVTVPVKFQLNSG